MSDEPKRIDLTITPFDEHLNLDARWVERQNARELAEYQQSIQQMGGANQEVKVDTSEQGLAKNADAASQMQGRGGGLTPDTASFSEQVRDKAQGLADQPQARKVADEILKTITGGIGLDDLTPEALQKGKLKEKVGLNFGHGITNTIEELAKRRAKEAGLDSELTKQIVGITGVASAMLFPSAGGVGKAGKALKEGLAAEKAGTNLERVSAAADVKQVMKNISLFNEEKLAASRKTVTHAETVAASRGALSLEDALALKDDITLPNDKMLALRDHYNAAASYVTDLAKRTIGGDTQAASELTQAFEIARTLAAKDEQIGRNVARGLESRKILSQADRAPIDIGQLGELSQLLQGAQDVDPMMLAQRLTLLTKAQRERVLKTSPNSMSLSDFVYSGWMQFLLSNPVTHAANFGTSAIAAAWAPAERFMAANLDFGVDRSVYRGEAAAMLYGSIVAIEKAFRAAGKAIREGGEAGLGKVEHAGAPARLGQDAETVFGRTLDTLALFLPTRWLVAEDGFWKAIFVEQQAWALAYREAALEGKSGREFYRRMAEIANNLDAYPTIKAAAESFAAAKTLNAPLDELGRIGKIGKGLTDLRDGLPMGRLVLPFIRTPTNELHTVSEYTPLLNLFSDTLKNDIMAGGERRALALAKLATSAMIMAVTVRYAAAPIDPDNPVPFMTYVTGAGPADPRERKTLETMGWKPFAIYNPLDKQYYSISRLGPFGTSLGVAATATEVLGQVDEHTADVIGMAAVISTSRAMVNKTYMEGLSSFLDSMGGDPGNTRKFFESLARSAVPAGVAQFNRTYLDDTQRETFTLIDQAKSRIPGLSKSLPPRRNLWGEPIQFTGGWGPDIASPIYTSPVKEDPVSAEIVKQRVALSMPPKYYPMAMAQKPMEMRIGEDEDRRGIPLTPQEYDHLVLLTANGVGGQPPLRDALANLMRTPQYQNQSDGPEGMKAVLIKNIVTAYKQAALAQLLRDSAGLQEALDTRIRSEAGKLTPKDQQQPDTRTKPGLIEGLLQKLGG